MDKGSKTYMIIWCVFAVLSFVSAWLSPSFTVFCQVINWGFGVVNVPLLIGVISTLLSLNKTEIEQKENV